MAGRRQSELVARLDTLEDGDAFDVIVLGAGAAGLAAGALAAGAGARVLIVEATGLVGGTSALTAGTLWVPGRYGSDGLSPTEDRARAGRYLEQLIGADDLAPLRRTFLDEAGAAIEHIERTTAARFVQRSHHPDYVGDVEGAAVQGRAIEAVDFDGRLLGPALALIRPPLKEFTVLGGFAPNRDETAAYSVIATDPLSAGSFRAALRAAPRMTRHVVDRVRGRRSSHLTMGNALVGRLLHTLLSRPTATVLLHTEASELLTGDAGVIGVRLRSGAMERTLTVRSALISATGGFNRDGARRAGLLGATPERWSAVADGNRGRAHRLLERAGAAFVRQGSHAFWAPVSLPARRDGSQGVYPHFALDRGKPGFLVVDSEGRRYLDESQPYHTFGETMIAHDVAPPAFLIADAAAVRRYGIGAVRPGGWGLRRRLREGYVVRAGNPARLADALGLDHDVLRQTIERFNADAERGVDPQFRRGETPYQRNLGAHGSMPNPSLGPLRTPPYYAVRLYPGDIGAASGFATDEHARALDAGGRPIGRLYVLGSDMRSIMSGRYPGPGITLGPAVVFARLAVRHALGEDGAP